MEPADTDSQPADDARRVVLPPVLRSGTAVPAGATLSSDDPNLHVGGGRITSRAAVAVRSGILVDRPGPRGRVTDAFDVTVLPSTAMLLVAGTRHPHPDPLVYAPRIAFSLHLALVAPDGTLTRLNDDRGVLFPKAVPTADVDVYRVRTLLDPWVAAVPGGYLVVGSPGLPDGTPEDAAASSVLMFSTPDLVDYEELGLIDLGTTGGVRRPGLVHDAAGGELVLWWTDARDQVWSSRAVVAGGPWARPTRQVPVVPAPALPDREPGRELTCALPLDDDAVQRLLGRFGRIRNVAVDVPALQVPAGAAARDLPWAQLRYDDGSLARRPVDWEPSDLAHVDWDTPGEYPVRGTVRQRSYPFPFAVDRSDPTVLAYQGRYYFIATDDTDGNCVETPGLLIRVADTVEALATAPEHTILRTGPVGIAGCFWAPELHVLAGRLHCFFAPSIGAADWAKVQAHVMRLREGGDPVVAADWEEPRPVLRADSTPLQLDADHPGISLDMTYLEDGGRGHVLWSQRYITDRIGDAELWIATVDPADPWRLTSDPVRLATAEYGWDHEVAEGPFALRHQDRIVVTYAGSSVGPTYVVGAVEARSGTDLLDPSGWTKSGTPLLCTSSHFTHWGPGHNTFGRDEDGVEIVVFHAHPTIGTRGRSAALRRIHWAADGHLVLDQRPDEEVAPHLRAVRTTVHVVAAGAPTPAWDGRAQSAASER